jgi:hypothetical protein
MRLIAETAAGAVDEIGSLNDSRLRAAEMLHEASGLVNEAIRHLSLKNIKDPSVGNLYNASLVIGEAIRVLTEVQV